MEETYVTLIGISYIPNNLKPIFPQRDANVYRDIRSSSELNFSLSNEEHISRRRMRSSRKSNRISARRKRSYFAL